MEINTETLFTKLQEEKKTGELIPLPRDFYKSADSHIRDLGHIDDGQLRDQRTANASKILRSLKEKRTQKILVYLAYDRQLPQPVPEEEESMYKQIRSILNRAAPVRTSKVKIAANIPQFVTASGKKMGPFRQNEIVDVDDATDLEYMLNNKLGEILV